MMNRRDSHCLTEADEIRASRTTARRLAVTLIRQSGFTHFMSPETRITYRFSRQDSHDDAPTHCWRGCWHYHEETREIPSITYCSIIGCRFIGKRSRHFSLTSFCPLPPESNLIKLFRNQQVFNGRPCCGLRCISRASPTSANASGQRRLFMYTRCPNVLFLLLANPAHCIHLIWPLWSDKRINKM